MCSRKLKQNRGKKNNFFGKLPGLPENQSILAEFESKHADWYENAYNNQKPIVGGISGHTLAYLNLYAAALKEVNAEDRGGYPSPEMLRAALMAGLIGHKRHHSYDEVMTASTAVDFEPRLTYVDRAGYSDLFNSGDPDVKKSAAVALSEVKQDYFLIKDKSVFKEIGDRVDAAGLESVQNVLRSYMDTINQRSAPMAATAKKLTEEVIGQLNFG